MHSSAQLSRLAEDGATVYVGHSPDNLLCNTTGALPDALVISSAIPDANVEVQLARERGVPVYKRSEWLQRITSTKQTSAVAGTHGKTTTSSMLSTVLMVRTAVFAPLGI